MTPLNLNQLVAFAVPYKEAQLPTAEMKNTNKQN